MVFRVFFQAAAVVLLLHSFLPAAVQAEPVGRQKRIIGQECWVHIKELDLDFLARVDTGATFTSLHATDFLIVDGTHDPRENVGRTINFLTISSDGEYKRMEAEIAKVQSVRTAQGREKRYMVWLTLTGGGLTKRVLANLRDRSKMKYKLLVGRDWLSHDFLVDVDMHVKSMIEEGEEE